MAEQDLILKIGGDMRQLAQALAETRSHIKATATATKTLLGVELFKGFMFGVNQMKVGLGFAKNFIVESVNEAREADKYIRRLKASLQGIGVDYGKVEKQIDKVADAWRRQTGIDDEKQMAGLATLINMTGDYNAAMKSLPIAMDLAAKTGMDLETSSMLVGKAMGGNTQLLKRYGIQLSETKDKQKIYNELVQKISGGRAGSIALANSQLDVWDRISGEYSEIKKSIGVITKDYLEPAGNKILSVLREIKDVGIVKYFEEIDWEKTGSTFADTMRDVIFGDIGQGFLKMLSGVASYFKTALSFGMKYIISEAERGIEKIGYKIGDMWNKGRLDDKVTVARLKLENSGIGKGTLDAINKDPNKYADRKKYGNDVADYAEAVRARQNYDNTDDYNSIDKKYDDQQAKYYDETIKSWDEEKKKGRVTGGAKQMGKGIDDKYKQITKPTISKAELARIEAQKRQYYAEMMLNAKEQQENIDYWNQSQNASFGNPFSQNAVGVKSKNYQVNKQIKDSRDQTAKNASEARAFYKKMEMKRNPQPVL